MKKLTVDLPALLQNAREEHKIIAAFYAARSARDAANAAFVAAYQRDGQTDMSDAKAAIAAFVDAEARAWPLLALPIAEVARRIPVSARTIRVWCKNADEQIPNLRCELRSDGWYVYLQDVVSIIMHKGERNESMQKLR